VENLRCIMKTRIATLFAALQLMPGPTTAATVPERDAIDPKYQWDLSRMYPSQEAWDAHYRRSSN